MATGRLSSDSLTNDTSDAPHHSQHQTGGMFDDEYADDYAESVHTTASRRSDPFRDPVVGTPISPIPERQNFIHFEEPAASPVGPRNSTRKSYAPIAGTDPDTPHHHFNGNDATYLQPSAIPRRAISLVSTASTSSPDSPTLSGPSHPYNMYPQNFAPSRTPSVAPSNAHSRNSTSQDSPTHPYSMYPQTTQSSSSTPNDGQSIPLGFPGHPRQFHRRIGPEGEEQDIVGLEGHAEQLPPYTRYPEAHDNKSAVAAQALIVPQIVVNHETNNLVSPVEEVATATPETDQHPPEADSIAPTEATLMVPNTAVVSEKYDSSPLPLSERRGVKGFLKRRVVGGIKVWMLLLALLVAITIAAVCGGVIGSVLSGERQRSRLPFSLTAPSDTAVPAATTVVVTTTRYVDATPIPTPTSMSPLPTGAFAVSFATPLLDSSECLTDSSQAVAWSCDFPTGQSSFAIDVEYTNGFPLMSMFNPSTNIDYGTQPPYFQNQTLYLLQDLENSTYGPGYQFSMYYNKLVVLPASMLSASTNDTNEKRQEAYDPTSVIVGPPEATTPAIPKWISRKHIQPNDKPWFCWFNETFIDGFIYVNGSISNLPTSAVPLSYSTPQSSILSDFTSILSISTDFTATLSTPASSSSCTTATPTAFSGPSSTLATVTSTATWGAPGSYSSPPSYPSYEPSYPYGASFPHPVPLATATYPSQNGKRGFEKRVEETAAAYPRLMKLEERRLTGMVAPAVCTQMSRASDGSYTPLMDSAGDGPMTVALDSEQDPSSSWRRRKRDDYNGPEGCYCQWCS